MRGSGGEQRNESSTTRKRNKRVPAVGCFFILLLTVFPLTLAQAQQRKNIPRIGFLGNSTAKLEANLIGPFREGLRDLGYVEGQKITIEYR